MFKYVSNRGRAYCHQPDTNPDSMSALYQKSLKRPLRNILLNSRAYDH